MCLFCSCAYTSLSIFHTVLCRQGNLLRAATPSRLFFSTHLLRNTFPQARVAFLNSLTQHPVTWPSTLWLAKLFFDSASPAGTVSRKRSESERTSPTCRILASGVDRHRGTGQRHLETLRAFFVVRRSFEVNEGGDAEEARSRLQDRERHRADRRAALSARTRVSNYSKPQWFSTGGPWPNVVGHDAFSSGPRSLA